MYPSAETCPGPSQIMLLIIFCQKYTIVDDWRALITRLTCSHTQLINFFMMGSLSYRNQSIDLQSKSMGWFLYDKDLHHERVKYFLIHLFHCFIYSTVDLVILSFLQGKICLRGFVFLSAPTQHKVHNLSRPEYEVKMRQNSWMLLWISAVWT